jgi:hypothetical protein
MHFLMTHSAHSDPRTSDKKWHKIKYSYDSILGRVFLCKIPKILFDPLKTSIFGGARGTQNA